MLKRLRHAMRVRLIRVVEEVMQRHEAVLRCEVEAGLRREADRVIQEIRGVELRSRRNVFAAAERRAVAASARFAYEAMPTALTFPRPRATLEYALGLAPAEGMALEFGVWTGQTLKVIAAARAGKDVYGFDSFEGLPEPWRTGFPSKAFGVDGSLPEVPGAELVVGWFDDTLPEFLAEHPGQVAFLHVDADLYSSARTVLDLVGPRLAPDAVIVFDEYFNYPGWEQHEHRAWQEYVERTGVTFRYEGYTADNEQVVLRLTHVDESAVRRRPRDLHPGQAAVLDEVATARQVLGQTTRDPYAEQLPVQRSGGQQQAGTPAPQVHTEPAELPGQVVAAAGADDGDAPVVANQLGEDAVDRRVDE